MNRHFLILPALLVGLMFPIVGHGQEAKPAEPSPRMARFERLQQQLSQVFAKKDYEQAMGICREQMIVVPESPEPHYNLACAMAQLGRKETALIELSEAVKLGFNDSAHMREDDDLASLRQESHFNEIVKKARELQLAAPHETSVDIAGVKMVEGFPEGGLRYRLRIGVGATAEKPARLLVWLHPSGESLDAKIEQMSPALARDGFAVLVCTQKDYSGWTDEDARALLDRTLPDLANITGLSIEKPILMGFDAGGQLALQLWHDRPKAFGGLILNDVYPIDLKLYAAGKVAPLDIPKDEAVKSCPIFTFVGDEQGAMVWGRLEDPWRHEGVPLTVRPTPGEGHDWLLSDDLASTLHAWLKEVAAGELPNGDITIRPKHPHDEGWARPPLRA